jgi:hypothetical protein
MNPHESGPRLPREILQLQKEFGIDDRDPIFLFMKAYGVLLGQLDNLIRGSDEFERSLGDRQLKVVNQLDKIEQKINENKFEYEQNIQSDIKDIREVVEGLAKEGESLLRKIDRENRADSTWWFNSLDKEIQVLIKNQQKSQKSYKTLLYLFGGLAFFQIVTLFAVLLKHI